MRIFSSVMDAMGPNFHMVVENVIEAGDLTAFVIWHLGKLPLTLCYSSQCPLLVSYHVFSSDSSTIRLLLLDCI